MMPSSCASTSIEALSVSMVRRTAPASNASPSLTFHSEMPPSVMVGDCARMKTVSFGAPYNASQRAGNPHHGGHEKVGVGAAGRRAVDCAQ